MAREIVHIPARQELRNRAVSIGQLIRVAAYCRVSTEQDEQLNSFENQVAYYTEFITRNPQYELAGIYADATCIIGTNQSPARGRRFVPTFFVFSTLEAAKG